MSDESSTNSSADCDNDEEEPIDDYGEEEELIDSDFLILGSSGPQEDVLEPVPQDEEEGFSSLTRMTPMSVQMCRRC